MSKIVDSSEEVPFDKLHEECGVFGIFGHPQAAAIVALALYRLLSHTSGLDLGAGWATIGIAFGAASACAITGERAGFESRLPGAASCYTDSGYSSSGRTTNMVNLTETAVGKVREILETQDPKPAGLRISVVGGGCSGFSYSMAFENAPGMLDKTYNYDGLKVFVDQASMLYLDGAEVDYVETLEGSGFKFNNPHVKSTCGCGSSFSA